MSKLVTHADALKQPCMKCGAEPGVSCNTPGGNHHAIRMVGMVGTVPSSSAGSFYISDEWRAVRYSALKRSSGRCECCGSAPQHGTRLHVDHIKPKSKFPDIALTLSNLQVLCEDCNLGKGAGDQTDWRRK